MDKGRYMFAYYERNIVFSWTLSSLGLMNFVIGSHFGKGSIKVMDYCRTFQK